MQKNLLAGVFARDAISVAPLFFGDRAASAFQHGNAVYLAHLTYLVLKLIAAPCSVSLPPLFGVMCMSTRGTMLKYDVTTSCIILDGQLPMEPVRRHGLLLLEAAEV